MLDSIILASFIVIILISLVGVFLARRTKDPCLKDFQEFLTTMQQKSGKRIWGRLAVETSGIEFRYAGNYWDQDHVETSFILYKEEFGSLYLLFRFHDELSEEHRLKRLKDLKKSYHPLPHRRFLRKVRNIFNSVKDALIEAIPVLAQAKSSNPALKAMTSQQRYVTKVQGDLINYLGSSYDPLLERHIGNMVVLEVARPDGVIDEHVGVFKEYSSQFLEVMDISYQDGEQTRLCDIITPRAHAVIRHSAESVTARTRVTEGKQAVSSSHQ